MNHGQPPGGGSPPGPGDPGAPPKLWPQPPGGAAPAEPHGHPPHPRHPAPYLQPAPGHPPQPGQPAQGHPAQGQLAQGHPAPGHPAPGHPAQSHPAQSHPAQGQPAQGHPVPGHPAQGYPHAPAQPSPYPHGAPPAHGPPGAQGWASGPGVTPAAAPKSVGLFDKMPCPHCGADMSTQGGAGAAAVGGLVGWLVVKALASKYYCPTHGEVPKNQLPSQHQSVATMRTLAMLAGAGALLVLVFFCLIAAGALQGMR